MFCDLRGFTALAENLQPDQVIEVLNRYLGLALAARCSTTAGRSSPTRATASCRSSAPRSSSPTTRPRALAAARADRPGRPGRSSTAGSHERGLTDRTLDVGIGVNTGAVMSGSVGSERRLEYAAVGDATNAPRACRRSAATRPSGSSSPATTVDQIGGPADGLRRFGEIELRGRSEPVVVYALGSGAVQ